MVEKYFTEHCFCCGKDNPRGISLRIEGTVEGAEARCSLDEQYQSFPGVAHGGIVTTLLDEVLWYAFYHKGHRTVTRRIEIVFRKPVPLGAPLIITGTVGESSRHGLWKGSASVRDESGAVLASATGLFAETAGGSADELLVLSDKS